MRAGVGVATLIAALLLTACTGSSDSSEPDAADPTCPTPKWDARVVDQADLRSIDEGGPNIDRLLIVTRAADGDLCAELSINGADTGATTASYRIVARRGDQEWRQDGEDPDGQLPLRIDRGGCVTVVGEEAIEGQQGGPYRARARLRIGCESPS